MKGIHTRLYEGAYDGSMKTEQRTIMLAVFLLLVQLGLLVYLVLTKGFALGFVGLYLLHLLVLPFLLARIWLDSHPEYRRHLTLTEQGVCYRAGFLKKEQEFDWDEVDEVRLQLNQVEFILKNEAKHLVPFNMIHNSDALHRANQEIRATVLQKGITLTDSQN